MNNLPPRGRSPSRLPKKKKVFRAVFRMTRFLSWVQLRRRKRLDKMATNAQKVFHDGMEFSVTKLGNPNLEFKKEQYDVIRAIYLEKRDVLTVLPTGFGKSLCYQALPAIFDFMESEGKQKESIVIVVSPLNALIRDQLQKLKGCLNVCVLQSTVEDEEQNVMIRQQHVMIRQQHVMIRQQQLF